MDRFVRDLLALPPMEPAQERALARLAHHGDHHAREALITSGMRAVALRARQRGLQGEDLRDAVQSGAIGLIRAIDRFDPDRGARLATYAWHWIGAAMTVDRRNELSLQDHDRPTEVPDGDDRGLLDGMPAELADVLRARFGLSEPAGSPLPRHVVADRLGLSVAQVRTREGKAMRQLRARLAKVVDRAPPQ
ncbi:sigma-70 family RNA polymerase sigma factor [Aeromicrobium sp.]|uniref:sigma-70 family RNA polymerase sigma factor n=1 Tax=Aeromicrobium sp. TaxID=1871063 RepID=UPI003C58428A